MTIKVTKYHNYDSYGFMEISETHDGGFYVYVNFGHQASIITNRESLQAMRDEIDKVLGESNVQC